MPSWLRSLEQRARRIVYRTPAPPALRTIADILFRTTMSFNRDDGSHMAAGVAYYAVFSLFPLTLASIALASFILDDATIQQRLLEFLEEQLPGSGASDFVQDNIRAIAHAHGAVGVVAVAALLWSGRAVFGAVHRVLNRAWKVSEPPHFVLYQVGQVTAAVLAALLFMSSTVFGTAGRVLAGANVLFSPAPWETIFTVVPFFLSTPLFIVLYRFVPDTRVRWREAAWGGLIAGIGFEVTRTGFAYYLANISNLDVVYGSLTTVVILMLFLYIVSVILVWGAELASEISKTDKAGLLDIRGHLRPVPGGLASVHHRPVPSGGAPDPPQSPEEEDPR